MTYKYKLHGNMGTDNGDKIPFMCIERTTFKTYYIDSEKFLGIEGEDITIFTTVKKTICNYRNGSQNVYYIPPYDIKIDRVFRQ